MLGTRKESSASVEWKTNHQKNLSAPFLEKMLWLHCWELSSIVRKQIVMWWWYFTWVPWTWQASGTFDGRQADGQRAWQGVPISSWWLCWQGGSQPLAGFVDNPCSLTWHSFTYPMDCLTSCTFLIVEWQNTTCPSIFSETSATFQNFWRNNQFLTLVQNKEVLNGTKLCLHHLRSSTHLSFNMSLSTPST